MWIYTGVGRTRLFKRPFSIQDWHLSRSTEKLHTHNPVIIHGDARLHNLIERKDQTLFWVDFMSTAKEDRCLTAATTSTSSCVSQTITNVGVADRPMPTMLLIKNDFLMF